MKARCDRCQWVEENLAPVDDQFVWCGYDPSPVQKHGANRCRHFLPSDEPHTCGNCEWEGKNNAGEPAGVCYVEPPSETQPVDGDRSYHYYTSGAPCSRFQPRGAFREAKE